MSWSLIFAIQGERRITSSSNYLSLLTVQVRNRFFHVKNNFYLFLYRIQKSVGSVSYLIIRYIGASETRFISLAEDTRSNHATRQTEKLNILERVRCRCSNDETDPAFFPRVSRPLCYLCVIVRTNRPNGDENHWNSHLSTLYNCNIVL